MPQFLSRGFEVKDSCRIRKTLVDGDLYQICCTNGDCLVLAVDTALHDQWIERDLVSSGLFSIKEDEPSCAFFCGRDKYLISSLLNGPFPNSTDQIEAFSVSFRQCIDAKTLSSYDDALYIEEYSMFLPLSFDDGEANEETAFVRWISGGTEIPLSSGDKLAGIMSWLPAERLRTLINAAGFEFKLSEGRVPETRMLTKNDSAGSDHAVCVLPDGEFTLVGRPELERFFRENIIDVVTHREQYERMGISFPGATVLHGPPGCGKTYAVEKLAEYLGWKRFDIDSGSIASSYIHATSKLIADVFNAAIDAAPSILVIDEMEAFLSSRADAGPSGTHHIEEVAEFLRRIPEAVSKGVLIFAMTNMLDKIDPAIIRKGRFDYIIEVKMASAQEIAELLKSRFRELPVDETVDIEAISQRLDGHPMSDVSHVLKEAGRSAIKKHLDFISMECFDEALSSLSGPKEKRRIGF